MTMEFAFLDESGDLGERGSKYLVLCLLCTKRKKEIVKIIVNAKKRMLDKSKTRRWLNSHQGEIKAHNFPDINLQKTILRQLSKVKMWVYYVTFKKGGRKVDKIHKTLILSHLLKHSIINNESNFPSKIIADMDFFNKKKENRFLMSDFIEEYKEKPEAIEVLDYYFQLIDDEEFEIIKDDDNLKIITIEHFNSRNSEELQAVDLIAGSIFQKFEHGDDELYNTFLGGDKKIQIEGINLVRKLK